jgi:hypothetical protein
MGYMTTRHTESIFRGKTATSRIGEPVYDNSSVDYAVKPLDYIRQSYAVTRKSVSIVYRCIF